jgi:hypothetical protein
MSASSRNSFLLTPDGKFHGSSGVGSPRVRIPYIGGEELNEAARGVFVQRKQFRERAGPGSNPYNVLGHACSLLPFVNDIVLYHS